jgi:hypothetical protein
MDSLIACDFLPGYQNEIVPFILGHTNRLGIYKLIVLTQNQKMVAKVMIFLGDKLRAGIGMSTKLGMGMRVTPIPGILICTSLEEN